MLGGQRHRRSRSDGGFSLPSPDQLGVPAGAYGLPKSRLSSVRKAEDYGFDAIQEESGSPTGSIHENDLAFSPTSAKSRAQKNEESSSASPSRFQEASSSSETSSAFGSSGSSGSSSSSSRKTTASSNGLASPATSSFTSTHSSGSSGGPRTPHNAEAQREGLQPRQPEFSKPPRPNAARHRRIRSEDIVFHEQWNASSAEAEHGSSVSSPKHAAGTPNSSKGVPSGAASTRSSSRTDEAADSAGSSKGSSVFGGLWDRRNKNKDKPADIGLLNLGGGKKSPSASPRSQGRCGSPKCPAPLSPRTAALSPRGSPLSPKASSSTRHSPAPGSPLRSGEGKQLPGGQGHEGGHGYGAGPVGVKKQSPPVSGAEKEGARYASPKVRANSREKELALDFKGPGLVIPSKSPYASPFASPFTSPRHSGIAAASPRLGGMGGGAGSLIGSPSAMAAQVELDRVKLQEIQNMFQLKQSWQSPKVEGRAGAPHVAKPVRTPNVSDYYRGEEAGPPVLLPSMACVLQKPFRDIREWYRVAEKELGRGNFGVIRLAERRETGERFACKTITKEKLECWEDVEDVKREVQIMELLRGHPHVISIVETFEDHKEVHLIMELCEGGELFDRILERGYYAERQAAKVCRTMCEVLEYIHARGIVHRDLKPENVLLISKKSDTRLKVIDFGMAIHVKPGERCRLRAGTPNYIAPEVIGKNYAHEADVWSVGVILYVLLCGLPPFWGDTTEDVFKSVLTQELDFETDPWPTVSVAAKDLVRRMLARDYKKRLTASEVLSHPWIKMLT